VCVCVCVCERERECEREGGGEAGENENKIINRGTFGAPNSSYFPFLLPSVKDIFRSMDVVNVPRRFRFTSRGSRASRARVARFPPCKTTVRK